MDIEQLREIVRARHRRVTAFQLGVVAAEHLGPAARDANPYAAGSRGDEHFRDGVSLYELHAALPSGRGAGR